MNIVFFGTPDFAMPVLEALIKNGYNVSRFQPPTLKDGQVFQEFKSLKPDLCVVAAYGKILPARYLDVPKYGFINIHPSLLPKYRGPSPIQTAILNGDPVVEISDAYGKNKPKSHYGTGTETGVTIILMDDQIDHGPILAQKTYNLQPTTYNLQASKELFELGAKLLVEILPGYINGELKPKEQDHSQATFTKMFTREDGRINWDDPAQKIYNQVRALNPEPGTWTTWNNKIINIKKAELRDGKVRIQTIQMEGKREMPFEEFLRGHPDFDISQLK
ncbi:MAG: hypothetical protein HYT67_00680 [Candidatus Yanofskybacteria bacterium]|nr:hypothetical protein [Candidatus Yanofskybacteria bacterium]